MSQANQTAASAQTSPAQATSLFLGELSKYEGIDTSKEPQPRFQEEVDEARWNLIRAAKRELDNLHGIEQHKRMDAYGHRKSAWWTEGADGRIQIEVKDGTRVIALLEGKTAWILATPADGCRFLAGVIDAAERKELDRFLKVKPKKTKEKFYSLYTRELHAARQKAMAQQVLANTEVGAVEGGTDV